MDSECMFARKFSTEKDAEIIRKVLERVKIDNK